MRHVLLFLCPLLAYPQGTAEDYERARTIPQKIGPSLAMNVAVGINWIGNTHRFQYLRSVKGGLEVVLFDAETLEKRVAFDHAKMAAALGQKYTATNLPFRGLSFEEDGKAVIFTADAASWRCTLADYTCTRSPAAPQAVRDPAGSHRPHDPQYGPPGGGNVRTSPDGQWEAYVRNYNVKLRRKGGPADSALSMDGSEGNYYAPESLTWSPDSKRLVAYRVRPGHRREIHYVESSPADQLQPRHFAKVYPKPGDPVDIPRPVLFEITSRKQIDVDASLFPNPYAISPPIWWKNGRGFIFEYNQRGHQIYRVIEVDGESGKARALIAEQSATFIDYRVKKRRIDIADGKEIIWASERDGWNHLYLYNGHTGKVKNQITRGPWVVREVLNVDEDKRSIVFAASGTHPGKDPYFLHWYRIHLDGTGMIELTGGDGTHNFRPSRDGKYFVDNWSRLDQPNVAQVRRGEDGKLLAEVERGDDAALRAAGWQPPEVFTAKGRDGKTDIWGILHKPSNFDPAKKYPVVEWIYSNPDSNYVPKGFGIAPHPLAELGFIVAEIDGMGTNHRGKAFHDVIWKNVKDAGFPDRVLWHKAVAASYPWYDISRVGIYGTSAGGQNALGALLFHGDFYRAAVANSGSHDNRLGNLIWAERWLGWPVGPQYAESSNVENASRLKGKLLLVVPELDTNTDPSNTYQAVNALIKAKKKFEFMMIPGAEHGGGAQHSYYESLLQDFFVHHLLGVEPPDWNAK